MTHLVVGRDRLQFDHVVVVGQIDAQVVTDVRSALVGRPQTYRVERVGRRVAAVVDRVRLLPLLVTVVH